MLPSLHAPAAIEPERLQTALGADAAPALKPVTRSDCVWLGLRIFLAGASLPILAACLMPQAGNLAGWLLGDAAPGMALNLNQLLLAAYLVLPPVALLGAVLGFEAYRVIGGSRRPFSLPGWAWALLCLLGLAYGATFWLLIPLYLHARLQRELTFQHVEQDAVHGLLAGVYMLLLPLAMFVGTALLSDAFKSASASARASIGTLALPLALSIWPALWICDFLLLMALASWRSARVLAPPQTHAVQYTLGALMQVSLGAGAWVSGLVLLFRP